MPKKNYHHEEMKSFGYCDLHEDAVDIDKYVWKVCWGCYHFGEGEVFPYVSVRQASEELNVSESTIRRWIKKRLLEGEVLEQGRYTGSLPAPKKYHITKESLDKLKHQRIKDTKE